MTSKIKTAAKTTKVYSLCVRLMEGETPEARFTFNATDDADAARKGSSWARYQGMTFYTDAVNASRSDVTVRLAEGRELNWTTNNEYID